MRTAKGTIFVFTFKEGVLSGVAHDLRFRFDRFDVRLREDGGVEAELPLASLRLDGPVRAGVVNEDEYDARQRGAIERTMHAEILHTARAPIARYEGRAVPRRDGFGVTGALALAGTAAPLAFDVKTNGGVHRARVVLRTSRWGIAPYSAMLGTIRVKDEVRVELALVER